MFDFIRSHQRLMQLVLLVLILPSFALIGVSGYTNYVSGDHDLVKVGSGAVTQQEFDQARSNQLRQLQQSSQGGFDPALVDNPQARRQLLDSLVDRRVLIDTATVERFSVSDTMLRQAIASMPELQADGHFSPERYNQILASSGMSTRDFEESQRAELALRRVLGPVSGTVMLPAPVTERLERVLTEQRTVSLKTFPASDFEKDIVISDDDIQAWYDKNKQSLELPEQVTAQYLVLDEQAAMSNLPSVSDSDLQAYYDQNKARYVLPARVNVSHIQITVPAGATGEQRQKARDQAAAIAKELKADPASFAQVAKEKSQDAGTASNGGQLGWITKGSWPANLEDVVFALKKGDISSVIDGPGGFHIFSINDVQPEHGESFEEAKTKVQAEVRRQMGADHFAEMATQLTSLVYDNPDSLEPAAQALGLKLRTAAGIARDRLLASDEVPENAASASEDAALLDDVRVRRALFTSQALKDKQNSGVIEISPDTMLVVRVQEILPAHVPELAQVTDHIRSTLLAERSLQAATKAGEQVLAALQKDDGTQESEGFGSPLSVSRIDPQGLPKEVTDAAFAASTSDLPRYEGVTGPQGYVVVRVQDAKAGTTNNPELAGLQQNLARLWGEAEEQAVLATMRVQAGVKVLPEAEQAIQGDNEDS
ncbi:SurA N-terminal domain-containing protein [Allopusillimonas ginsengisoli]|uniref:SurA N-terminal domain-containing protein n=1 Tax=Allopusillimonas ginsengisoli TaxID=453575 RepID=UPI00101F0F3D|nr:SurA N-terminal domain-containing protein [Allopusillimonas ginsengisoli]TEA77685.1 peptidylprolyl isomerase [Allopusillimonas ginsengisoli]